MADRFLRLRDMIVNTATNTGKPLAMQSDSRAGAAFKRVALRLNGQSDLPVEVPVAAGGFWKKLGRKIGLKN